jgi:two-component system phosphate regulon sensor histidine kinase PhoR
MRIRSWKFHAGRLALAAIPILILGWWTGYPERTLLVALLLYLAWNIWNVGRLFNWLQSGEDHIPESLGVWADIFDHINSLERKKRRRTAQYQEMIGEFQSLTDAFPDATLVIDANDNITWFNNAATELLGLEVPEDVGQAVTNLIRGPDFSNWLAVQPEVTSKLEMPCPRDDHTWLSISAVELREKQRLLILHDTTEVHNLEQIRKDFVANISHELRTPLTVLLGYLEMMGQSQSGEIAKSAARMQSQARQMNALLDDLLELSRLQSNEISSEEEIINVPAMLNGLKEQAEELSGGRHAIDFRIHDDLMLTGIGPDVESAFRNLIVNAVNYTPYGGDVSVSWTDTFEGPTLLVEDSGIGIPRRDIPRLTERFYRVGSDRARHTGGTGLGLAIVKHVLNAHQARLTIESELGDGSEFKCVFPPDRRVAGSAGDTAA